MAAEFFHLPYSIIYMQKIVRGPHKREEWESLPHPRRAYGIMIPVEVFLFEWLIKSEMTSLCSPENC